MSKKLLALLLALVMIVGSFTSVLADPATETKKEVVEDKKDEKSEEKKDEKSEEKKDEKSEEKKEEKTEEKTEEKKEEVKDEYLLKAIDVLKKAGFISGYSKDSEDFKAEKNVTRAEFASMIVRVKGLEDSAKALANLPTGFKDVPTNLWANGYIAVAKQQGIVNGYPNGTFQPNRQISYQDMATMLTIALGKNEAGTVYPAGYIVKAQQLGLFNNVKPLAYTDMATRGDVFKMVYNMVTSKEFGQRKVLQAIVIENNRVENLGENQVTVEVIKVVQKADWADKNRSSEKRGDQIKLTLDKDLKLDSEDLLGKVVNVTIDQNEKVIDITVDKSFDYIDGQIKSVAPKTIKVGNTKYSVEFDERYDDTDERIYRTYLNNKNYSYRDFAIDYEKGGYDFAKLTVKNGKVVFIDAYKFYDIAPVAEVKDGKVFYYDDTRSAKVTQAASLLGDIIFKSGKVYTEGKAEDIVKDDVIHFYEDYRGNRAIKCAIVRKDAKVQTKLVKTLIDRDDVEWAVGENGQYWLNPNKPYRLIASYEGKHFDVIERRFELKKFIEENVKILVAINGSAQLIQGDKAWKDGIHAVKRVTSDGQVNLLPPKTEAFWAKETRDTKYIQTLKIVNNHRLLDFNYDDIVYYEGSKENEIGAMGLVLPKKNIMVDDPTHTETITEKVSVKEGNDFVDREIQRKIPGKRIVTKGYADNFEKATITNRYITSGLKDYRYFENLNAYYVDKFGNLQNIPDFAAFAKDQKGNVKLEAYVLSEGELRARLTGLGLEIYNFLSDSEKIANIVVFKHAIAKIGVQTVYAEVADIWDKYNDSQVTDARFVDANGKTYDVEINYDFNKENFNRGDIVELNLDKRTLDKDQLVGYVERVVIKANDDWYPIETLIPRDTYKINGKEKYFTKDTQIFNKEFGDLVQVAYEEDTNFVLAIRYKATKGNVVYNTLDAATDRLNLVVRDAKGRQFVYRVTPTTEFKDVDGKLLGFGSDYLMQVKTATTPEGFKQLYVNGEVEVLVDKYTNTALSVRGFRTEAKVLKDYLDQAKKAIEGLKAQSFDYNSAANADTLNAAEFKKKAEKAIEDVNKAMKEAGIKDEVLVTACTVNGANLETTVALKINTSITTTPAKNAYNKKSLKDDNQAKADEAKRLANNGEIVLEKPFDITKAADQDRAAEAIAKIINAKLTLAGKEFSVVKADITNLKPVSSDSNACTFELVVGNGADQGKADFTFDIKLIEK